MIVAVFVVAKSSLVNQAECFTLLLTDLNAFYEFSRTIAFCEFIRIGISFNCATEFLFRGKFDIFDIVCIKRGCFSARRTFCNCSKAVPCNTLGVCARVLNIEYAILNTCFIKTLARFIPRKFLSLIFCHGLFSFNNIMIVYRDKDYQPCNDGQSYNKVNPKLHR